MLRAAMRGDSSIASSMNFRSFLTADTVRSAPFKNDVQIINTKPEQTGCFNNLLPADICVYQPNAQGDISENSLHAANRAHSPVVGASSDSDAESSKQYRKNVALLQFAMTQSNKTAIDALIMVCAHQQLYTQGNANEQIELPERTDLPRDKLFPWNNKGMNEEDKNNADLLLFAILQHNRKAIPSLLKIGAKINQQDANGRALLHILAMKGDAEGVKILLEHGAMIDIPDVDNATALHYAAAVGHFEVVETLLKSGAKKNVRDVDNKTPLHLAAGNGYLNVVKALVSKYAKASLKAVLEGKREVEEIDSLGWSNKSPLFNAVEYGHVAVARFLMEKGANIYSEAVDKKTPHSIGIESSNSEMAALLKHAGDKKQAELAAVKPESQPYVQKYYAYMREWQLSAQEWLACIYKV